MYYILVGILVLFAGMCEGLGDKLAFHNTSNNSFYGQNSWKNKYKNHDPAQGETFIGKYFVFLTDGFHMAKMFQHLFIFSSFPILLCIDTATYDWWGYLLVALGAWIIRGIGFNIIYHFKL